MIGRFVYLPILLGLAIFQRSSAAPPTDSAEASDQSDKHEWKYELEISTYLAQHARDYANPNFTADRDWVHFEGRYNYESLKTGSVWLGCNLHYERELKSDVVPWLNGDLELKGTPMIGDVFGDITGIAPGYAIEINFRQISFSTKGEYFVDAATHSGNFFYSWSELSYSPRDMDWFWIGIVVDRTKVLGEEFDVRRGPLVGFQIKNNRIYSVLARTRFARGDLCVFRLLQIFA